MLRRLSRTMATVVALSALVVVSQAGAADKLVVKGVDGTTDVFKVDDVGTFSGNKLGVGTATPFTKIHLHVGTAPIGASLYATNTAFTGSSQNDSVLSDFVVADGTATAGFRGAVRSVRARGTLQAPTAPAVDDLVFSLIGGIWDGAAVRNTADINFTVDGAVSSNIAPQRISFRTRTGGAGNYFERLTIKNDGKIGVGISTPTAIFDVNGDTMRLRTPKTPTSAAAACNQGDMAWDSDYVYVCVAANSWKRSSLASW